MSSTPAPPHDPSPLRVVQVVGGGSAGSAAHVRSLTAGLVARGVRVTVCASPELQDAYDFSGAGARFEAVAPRTDPAGFAKLRALCRRADLVHAHGLRAGVRAHLALRGRQGPPLVVTWHTRGSRAGGGARLDRLLERRVVRTASVVLGTCVELVDRARRRGARDARLAPVGVPRPRDADGGARRPPDKVRADLGAVDRPLLLVVARLEPHQGHEFLLDAARHWRARRPEPLVAVAGEGTLRPLLRRRVESEGLPVRILGRRDDVPDLLAAADLVVLPSRWESRALIAHEALRAGVALVATDVGGIRELVGDAAALVPYGDAPALARAVGGLLENRDRRAALVAAGFRQAALWPSEDDAVAQVLSVYDEVVGAPPL